MNALPSLQLTPEQASIVAHNQGPALVFAVAGAGKTTAMVHRIERLVRQGIFPPKKILATSFSKATVDDLKTSIKRWPACQAVDLRTLHSLSYRLLLDAERYKLFSYPLDSHQNFEKNALIVLHRALQRARDQKLPFFSELKTLDEEDFLTYVSACKGNLYYPSLDEEKLPPSALVHARSAPPLNEIPWYLDLFQVFERIRKELKLLTFDDMLVLAWESLHRSRELLASVQSRYTCVLVDEFQDVNLVQSEILDLITTPHRNYMVIGDDDQTIYEWRGARPDFILDFERRYKAKKFIISDNFRCRASHVALANRVIVHNRSRQAKHLSLTRGFDGRTFIHEYNQPPDAAASLVREVQKLHAEGYRYRDMAVLIRIYAQTPHIEHYLIQAKIPYKVVGSLPFYQRPENQTLLSYLRIARAQALLKNKTPLPPEDHETIRSAWRDIYPRPTRYLSSEQGEAVLQAALYQGLTFSEALVSLSGLRSWLRKRVEDFADTLFWLALNLETFDASILLQLLSDRLEYKDFLLHSSGFPETGQAKVKNVEGLIDYAKGRGSPLAFLDFLAALPDPSIDPLQPHKKEADDLLEILTIFRAKGLQWPVVFVPDCHQGTIPFGGNFDNMEEERRLFYVAITRTQKDLHLYVPEKSSSSSSFLHEADFRDTLQAVEDVRLALEQSEDLWTTPQLLSIARHTRPLHLDRYLFYWWEASDAHKCALARKIQSLFAVATRLDLLARLGLEPDHASLWDEFGPLPASPPDDAFPDLPRFAAPLPSSPPPLSRLSPSPLFSNDLSSPSRLSASDFSQGMTIRHPSFGVGTIREVFEVNHNLRLHVLFEEHGLKKIAPRFISLEILSPRR